MTNFPQISQEICHYAYRRVCGGSPDITPPVAEVYLTHVYSVHVCKFKDLKPPHTCALLRDLRVANQSPPHA